MLKLLIEIFWYIAFAVGVLFLIWCLYQIGRAEWFAMKWFWNLFVDLAGHEAAISYVAGATMGLMFLIIYGVVELLRSLM